MNKILMLLGLVSIIVASGCGSKKPEVSGAASVGEGEGDAAQGEGDDGLEKEADTSDLDPQETPKRSPDDRNPANFTVAVKKAYVLPLSENGACWDDCAKQAKDMMVDALPGLASGQFRPAAKALRTAISARDAKDVLPDIYVHLDCGFGQEITTAKGSQENRLAARWRGVKETLKLDAKDQCALSVWDADVDGEDELIGDLLFEPIQQAKNGTILLSSKNDELGQVVLVELFLDPHQGVPGAAAPVASTPKTVTPTETKPAVQLASATETKPIATTPAKAPPPPAEPAPPTYLVEVIKANLKRKKDDGQKWDTKLPYIGRSGDEMPDPFVEAYVNGYQSENPFMSTDTAQNTLYREWKKTGTVGLKPGDKLHFMVWDKDKVDHDLVGECIMDPIEKVKLGGETIMRRCGQVDFLVVKISAK